MTGGRRPWRPKLARSSSEKAVPLLRAGLLSRSIPRRRTVRIMLACGISFGDIAAKLYHWGAGKLAGWRAKKEEVELDTGRGSLLNAVEPLWNREREFFYGRAGSGPKQE